MGKNKITYRTEPSKGGHGSKIADFNFETVDSNLLFNGIGIEPLIKSFDFSFETVGSGFLQLSFDFGTVDFSLLSIWIETEPLTDDFSFLRFKF